MKKCIGRRVYDTDRAIKIGTHKFSKTVLTTLYRKHKEHAEYFLHLEIIGNKEDIAPISKAKAEEWAADHLSTAECLLMEAAEHIAPNNNKQLSVKVTPVCYDLIYRICMERQITRSILIEIAIRNMLGE